MPRLDGKKAIITGGSRGIGRAIALAYARKGADVVISYNTQMEKAISVVNEIKNLGGRALAVQADITSEEDRKKLVIRAVSFLGEIDIFVNNAGIYNRKDFLDISEVEYDKMMDVNAKAAFFLTQYIVKQMIVQKKGGSILNISSFRDRAVGEGMSHYQMSKAALTIFSKSLAVEMAKHRIRVNTISPGMILTDMHKGIDRTTTEWADRINSIPLKRAGVTGDLCPLAVYLVSDAADYVTAGRFVVDGGRSTNPAGMPLRAKL